jgi:hypothetical protein
MNSLLLYIFIDVEIEERMKPLCYCVIDHSYKHLRETFLIGRDTISVEEVKVDLLSKKQSISALIMRLMMFFKKDLVASKWHLTVEISLGHLKIWLVIIVV